MSLRPVRLVGASLYCPAGISPGGLTGGAPGPVPGFDPVARGVPRKYLKTMTRAVQLGVAAVSHALATFPAWAAVAPERRGLYVGASPQSGDPEDLVTALAACGPEPTLAGFAEKSVPLIPPLWLVKGLSNNILGYASAQHDLRGDNGNWCDGRLGGAVALTAAIHAVAEGRVDLAVAGGADSFIALDALIGRPTGEGAAFIVVATETIAAGAGIPVRAGIPSEHGAEEGMGELGAAAIPVALARRWLRGEGGRVGGVEIG